MKLIHVLLALVMSASSAMSYPYEGSGTKDDPYQIKNIYDLQDINRYTTEGKYFIITNDIDATETRYWNVGDHDGDSTTPDEPQGFMPLDAMIGTLDGDGHVIYNLFINRPNMKHIAFIKFTWTETVIRRLGLENCYIVGSNFVASFCRRFENGRIEECYATGQVIAANGGASGFCDEVHAGKIKNCYSSCSVIGNGGNAGFCYAFDFSAIERCYTTGIINSLNNATIYGDKEMGWGSFWDVETTGVPPDSNTFMARGLSTSEMKRRSSFPNWDFDNVWCIEEGRSYPRLKVFNRCTGDIYAGIPTGQAVETSTLEVSPNPTAGVSEISYTLLGPCLASITITNSLGEQVMQLLSGQYQEAGRHSVTFDASELPQGVYYCTMKAGGIVVTKKIVVVR